LLRWNTIKRMGARPRRRGRRKGEKGRRSAKKACINFSGGTSVEKEERGVASERGKLSRTGEKRKKRVGGDRRKGDFPLFEECFCGGGGVVARNQRGKEGELLMSRCKRGERDEFVF